MQRSKKSPFKNITVMRGPVVLRPYQNVVAGYFGASNLVKQPEMALHGPGEFLKITSMTPLKSISDALQTKKFQITIGDGKSFKNNGIKVRPPDVRESQSHTEHFQVTEKGRLIVRQGNMQEEFFNFTQRGQNQFGLPIEGRPFSKRERKNDVLPSILNTSDDKSLIQEPKRSVRENLSVDYRSPVQVPLINQPEKVTIPASALIKKVSDAKALTNSDATAIKNVEALKKALPTKLPDINDFEKRKIELTFKFHMSTLNRLIQERMKNSSLLNGKPKPPKLLSQTADSNMTKSQTFEKNSLTAPDSIIEEVWKNLKRYAMTKSKYKYRDINNYDKKVMMTMKTLLGRATSEYGNFSPKNKQTLNLEDDTDRNYKKMRSPQKPNNNNLYADFIIRTKDNPNSKIFIITGGYPDLRRALEERGWIENPDQWSKHFHLKWALKKIDINYDALQPYQYVNHFFQNITVTTKVGLARNIRNLIWAQNDDIDDFFPRCYDLNDVSEFDDFVEEFKFGQAIAILRESQNTSQKIGVLFKLKVCLALDICYRRVKQFDLLVNDMILTDTVLVSPEEWEILIAKDSNSILKGNKYERIIKGLSVRFGVTFDLNDDQLDESLQNHITVVLKKLKEFHPQLDFNRGKNIWIVKPANLSRGRGIACYNDLGGLLEHIKVRESEWIVQKYIENPLIAKNKKLDIRQWVLVTDWAPLTIWFYEQCYIRFTAGEYNPDDLANKFSHLTNNSIAKHAENFEMSEIDGNMWSSDEFSDHLKNITGQNLFYEKIQPQMKRIVIKSLQSVQDMMESRKNSFELFGYDFMIDDNYKPYLIEINSSPTMEYSTAVTQKLVKQVMEDTAKVLVDYGMSKKQNKKGIDTGNFRCICWGRPYLQSGTIFQ